MSPDEIQFWRDEFGKYFNVQFHRLEVAKYKAYATPVSLTIEDCVFLWDLGIMAEDDIHAI